jgi:ABC-type multidrug transport system ATPase subunit
MFKIFIPSYQVNPHFKLSNIKIEVKNGEIFSLIGKSGSGKSTVAKIAVGVILDVNSSISTNGIELNTRPDRLIPQFFSSGYVPQSLHLKPYHTVSEYLDYLFQNETGMVKTKLIKNYIQLFHIKKILNSKIRMLSGGERQKLALIEAISKPIDYLVLDEPFSQLDTEQKFEFIDIIKQLIVSQNLPCLLISHDLSDVIRLSHKIGIVDNGKIAFQADVLKFWRSKHRMAQRLKRAMISWKQETDLFINS